METKQTRTGRIVLASLAMYLLWGSVYLAIRVALESLPPLLMTGARQLVAGGALVLFARLRGVPWPTGRQWVNAALVGVLLLGAGSGGAAVAQQWVASGLAAVAYATIPLWGAVLSLFWGERPGRSEWAALAVGMIGIVLLNLDQDLRGSPLGALLLMASSAAWALGSNISKHVKLPPGTLGVGAEMIAGSLLLIALGLLSGETAPAAVSTASALAWLYLVVLASLVSFSAYMYLVANARLSVANSYAYVNPVVALALGALFAGERFSPLVVLATGVILASVVILSGRWPARRPVRLARVRRES